MHCLAASAAGGLSLFYSPPLSSIFPGLHPFRRAACLNAIRKEAGRYGLACRRLAGRRARTLRVFGALRGTPSGEDDGEWTLERSFH